METLKNITIILLFLLAVGLSGWSIITSHYSRLSFAPTNPKEADSFMQNVVATIFNETGNPSLVIVSPKMVHYPQDDTTDVFSPRVTVASLKAHAPLNTSSKPWQINADYAKASHGINQVHFWSHVNIHHTSDVENPMTTLLTDSLTIFPEQQIATTNEPITFIQPDTTIHATGMLADLNNGTIKLLSSAQGEYAPLSE